MSSIAIPARIKWPYVTHVVPLEAMTGIEKLDDDPSVGDVAICRLLTLGQHKRLDDRRGGQTSLFPGDVIACVFGNRYATDQYEGYVPPRSDTYHLLSIGGVCGAVGTKNERMPDPTVIEFLGYATDKPGRILNLRRYRLKPVEVPADAPRPTVIVSVGASMNSGKTTTCAMAIRGLASAGHRVVAAKLTGTAAVKDLRFMSDAGAEKVLDFTDYGCPSTYRVSMDKLMRLFRTLHSHVLAERPEFIVYEIADGIFQRETALLLGNAEFRKAVDHVLFAAVDALSAESGKRALESRGYRVLAFSGVVSASSLGRKEVVAATGMPCLSSSELSGGGITMLLEESRSRRKRA